MQLFKDRKNSNSAFTFTFRRFCRQPTEQNKAIKIRILLKYSVKNGSNEDFIKVSSNFYLCKWWKLLLLQLLLLLCHLLLLRHLLLIDLLLLHLLLL